MEIDEFTKSQGEFLKAEHVETTGSKAVIVAEATIVHNEKFNVDRLHIPVNINENAFTFDASKTNARKVSEALGSDTTKWVGRIIVIDTYKTRTTDGKMTDALNVKEILPFDGGAQPAPAVSA